jgi:hypothetical protein
MPVVKRNSVPNPDRASRAPFALPDGWTALRGAPDSRSHTRARIGPARLPGLHGTSAAWNFACAAAHPAGRRLRPRTERRDLLGCPPPATSGRASGHRTSRIGAGPRGLGAPCWRAPCRSMLRRLACRAIPSWDSRPSSGSSRGRFSRFARGRRRAGSGTVLATTRHVSFRSASCRLHVGSTPIRPASGPASQTGEPPEKRRARDGHGPQRRNG